MRVCIRIRAEGVEDDASHNASGGEQVVVIVGRENNIRMVFSRPATITGALQRMNSLTSHGSWASETASLAATSVTDSAPASYKAYNFENILRGPGGEDWDHVFRQSGCAQIVNSTLYGRNGIVLAHGHTGTGKTYTMDHMTNRCIEYIFSDKDHKAGGRDKTLFISVFELFQETIHDLITDSKDIRLHSAQGTSGVSVVGLTEKAASTLEESIQIISSAKSRRRLGQTNENKKSSRSHVFVRIEITEAANKGRKIKFSDVDSPNNGVISFVDLAGRERMGRIGHEQQRTSSARDAASLNKDLLLLGSVLKSSVAQRSGKPVYVPFRNTKLTRILSEVLSGNENCLLIGCISSKGGPNAEHTLSSLDFCRQAKRLSKPAQDTPELIREQDRAPPNPSEESSLDNSLLASHRSGFSALTSPKTMMKYPTHRDVLRLLSKAPTKGGAGGDANDHLQANQLDLMEKLEAFQERLQNLERLETVVNGEDEPPNGSVAMDELKMILESLTELQHLREDLVRVKEKIKIISRVVTTEEAWGETPPLQLWLDSLDTQSGDLLDATMSRMRRLLPKISPQRSSSSSLNEPDLSSSSRVVETTSEALKSLKARIEIIGALQKTPSTPSSTGETPTVAVKGQLLGVCDQSIIRLDESMSSLEGDMASFRDAFKVLEDVLVELTKIKRDGVTGEDSSRVLAAIDKTTSSRNQLRQIEAQLQITALSAKQSVASVRSLFREASQLRGDGSRNELVDSSTRIQILRLWDSVGISWIHRVKFAAADALWSMPSHCSSELRRLEWIDKRGHKDTELVSQDKKVFAKLLKKCSPEELKGIYEMWNIDGRSDGRKEQLLGRLWRPDEAVERSVSTSKQLMEKAKSSQRVLSKTPELMMQATYSVMSESDFTIPTGDLDSMVSDTTSLDNLRTSSGL
ncbi:hypothetical protein BSKO_09530 [Bryopsis sp. KO-2023]|nr:hypothetical protein BSKO_09530 [Bryopsis sp. KO-2023]